MPIPFKYVSRFLGSPVITLSRIDSYGRENVAFHYNKHEDNAYVQKTIPVTGFIKLLIQHIPKWNFKMTRYYGLYAKHSASDPSPGCRAVHPSMHDIFRGLNRQREMILLSFGYAPLQCPGYKKKMAFLKLYFKHERVSLDEL